MMAVQFKYNTIFIVTNKYSHRSVIYVIYHRNYEITKYIKMFMAKMALSKILN